MTRVHKLIAIIVAVIAAVLLVRHFDLLSYLTLENGRSFSLQHSFLGPVLFIMIYVAAILLLFPIIPFAVLAGAIFGLAAGFAYISIGAITGALIAFWVARRYGKSVVDRISRGRFKKMHEYDKKVERDGFRTVLLIRLIPFLPFKSPNYILGLTKVKGRDYVWATVIGVLPESFVFAYVGASFTTMSVKSIFLMVLVVGGLCTVGYLIGMRLFASK